MPRPPREEAVALEGLPKTMTLRLWLSTWLPFPHSPPRTQLLSCKWQEGRVLIQVLIEVNAQETQLLLYAFDFLKERRVVKGSTTLKIPPGLGLPLTGKEADKVGKTRGFWNKHLSAVLRNLVTQGLKGCPYLFGFLAKSILDPLCY